MTDEARRRAVIVLPTPFGPSRLIAARSGISASRSLSTTRRRYSAIPLRYLWQEFYAAFGRLITLLLAPRSLLPGGRTTPWNSGSGSDADATIASRRWGVAATPPGSPPSPPDGRTA